MSRFAAKPMAPRPPAAFNFTYSKLNTFENCPKKFGHLYVLKDVKEEDSDHLRIGNEVHAALAEAVSSGNPLAGDLAKYQHHVDRARKGHDQEDVKILVEQKLAMNRDFMPTEFFGHDVWFRGIVDVAKIAGDVAVIFDWKTGKPQEDSVQLALFAALIFSHHPKVQKVHTEFVWLKDDFSSAEPFVREDLVELWSIMLPRAEALEEAQKNMEFPPHENVLCKWCPVKQCAFNKKS